MTDKKNTDINMKLFCSDPDSGRAASEETAAARAAWPDTPEQFRNAVRQAVQAQCPGLAHSPQTEQAERRAGAASDIQASHLSGIKSDILAAHAADTASDIRPEHPAGIKSDIPAAHAADTTSDIRPEHPAGTGTQARSARRRHSSAVGKKRRWHRYLLPAAAILIIGSAAIAAGSGWLREQLLGRGFSQEEADVLVMTEPQQQVTEMDVAELPEGTSVKEMSWSNPLLTVNEAYFDGTTLYFLAEPSEESLSYDLYLRDHASLGGHDSMTGLQKIEGENKYLGRIDLRDAEYTDEILSADSVSVTMNIVAYPKYEGQTLYTWKDAAAYEKLFETGAFRAEDGTQYYIMSAEDSYAGYTPQQLTVEISLTDTAKEIIRQYLENGGLEEENLVTSQRTVPENDPADASEQNSTPDMDTAAENDVSLDNNTSSVNNALSENGTSSNGGISPAEPGNQTKPQITVDGNHISGELTGTDGSLLIDAQLVRDTDSIYTGTLQATEVSADIVQSLYEEGDPELWQKISDEENNWQYGDQLIFADSFAYQLHYQNDTLADFSAVTRNADEELQDCENALSWLGLEAIVTEDKYFASDNTNYYVAQPVLEGLPIAYDSQWPGKISLCMENGQLAYLNAPYPLTVTEKDAASLINVSEMLQHVAAYVASGDITPPESQMPVTKITLEYYVDLTKQGIVFRPVWNFKVPYMAAEEEPLAGRENFFYIDAITGALVKTVWGW